MYSLCQTKYFQGFRSFFKYFMINSNNVFILQQPCPAAANLIRFLPLDFRRQNKKKARFRKDFLPAGRAYDTK
jgi:hypothetical protein